MASESDLRVRKERADRFRRFMASDGDEVLASLKAAYLDRMLKTDLRDVGLRERLFLAAKLTDEFRQNLTAIAESGKLEERELRRIEGRKGIFAR